mmetsp:Transcript_26015/g.23031  ORF Transcript_26015/g.23031 Transcript_26015/m.23031 type:complete len:145 (+) Transcript_26015:311-745(+)
MLERSYIDPVRKHKPKLANRYSIDFGEATGKNLSKYGKMSFDKRKNEAETFQTQTKADHDNFEKNKRLIMNDNYNKTNRWNQNINSRENLISTYKLDKKVLYTPDISLKTLNHAITEKNLHSTNHFKNPKFQGECFKMERTHIQ